MHSFHGLQHAHPAEQVRRAAYEAVQEANDKVAAAEQRLRDAEEARQQLQTQLDAAADLAKVCRQLEWRWSRCLDGGSWQQQSSDTPCRTAVVGHA
jgi:hypothetical protein